MPRRYGAVLLTWLVAALGPAALAVIAIVAWVDHVCGDSATDCSWGFELVLAVPVLCVGVIATGPAAVGRLLRRRGDPYADATQRYVLIAGCVSLLLSVVTYGLAIAVLPPLLGRYLALRRAP
jgi:hypothetical protein